ncbi:MAG TPA: class I SAM-dependent rRNA methyltransferase [Ktedonobacterales bacterium]|jgi:23S rRNA (cytosine1962-C5)-methyltransferase
MTPTPNTPTYPVVRLKPGRERPILSGHPWIFSGALQSIPPDLAPGAIVDAVSARDEFTARGYLNAGNSLALRVLSLDPAEAIDAAFFERRVREAASLRAALARQDTNAYRLIHAEGDFLPGLVVDRYDRWLVAQIHTAGMEAQRDLAAAALRRVVEPEGILVRNDLGARGREGLPVGAPEVLWGGVPERVTIREAGVAYLVDPYHGQKTGFFLDQRDKRARVAECAVGARSLLNCFAYTGGFALAALAANAALVTTNVDASKSALELARANFQLNGHDPDAHEFADEDVGAFLKARVEAGTTYDIVVVDPPAYAKSLESKNRALYGYEQLNALAGRVVAPGGFLLTCSCSGAVTMPEFEAAVHGALLRIRRRAQVVETFTVSLDHPTLLGFPEDRYLKALLLRVL